jgi:TRAP-type C4-dicarboxylate transport system permease small subunit
MHARPATWEDRVVTVFSAVAKTALAAMILLTTWDVVGRVVFASPLVFAYELVGLCLGIAIYAGLVQAGLARRHIRIDLLAGFFARYPRLDRARNYTVLVLEAGFFAIIAWLVAQQAMTLARFGESFMFLPLEKWKLLGFVAACAAIGALAVIYVLVKSVFGADASWSAQQDVG